MRFRVLSFISIAACLYLCSCKKDDAGGTQPVAGIPENVLVSSGSAQRIWNLFQLEIKYMSSAGSIDSVYTAGPFSDFLSDPQEIRFSNKRADGSTLRVFDVYAGTYILERVFPELGTWELGNEGKSLICVKYAPTTEGGIGGSFDVTYTDQMPFPFPLDKSLELETTQPLPNSRKAQVRLILASN